MIRHFTSTGIVAAGGSTLVHWHEKVQAWLAPGGHVEPNEDPVQALFREVMEETGLDVRILETFTLPEVSNLEQIVPPYTVMIEDVFDKKVGQHQHIDFIYLTTPLTAVGADDELPAVPEGWQWITRQAMVDSRQLQAPTGELVAPPEDVLKLGIVAVDLLENGHINLDVSLGRA